MAGHGSCRFCSCTYCRNAPEPRCAFQDDFVPKIRENIFKRFVKVCRYGSEKDIAIYINVVKTTTDITEEELYKYRDERS